MRLRSVFANILADLKLAQFLNDPGADEQSNHQSRAGGERRAKRQIPKDPERMKKRKKLLVKQPIKQVASNDGSTKLSSILQGCAVRSLELPQQVSPREPHHEPRWDAQH
jgi:hypothetical protein